MIKEICTKEYVPVNVFYNYTCQGGNEVWKTFLLEISALMKYLSKSERRMLLKYTTFDQFLDEMEKGYLEKEKIT